jgi:hypothetical protein
VHTQGGMGVDRGEEGLGEKWPCKIGLNVAELWSIEMSDKFYKTMHCKLPYHAHFTEG